MSSFKQNEEYNGCTWNLEVRRARAAIRSAPKVHCGVMLCQEGDPVYVEVSKAVALRAIADYKPGTTTTAFQRGADGWIFFG